MRVAIPTMQSHPAPTSAPAAIWAGPIPGPRSIQLEPAPASARSRKGKAPSQPDFYTVSSVIKPEATLEKYEIPSHDHQILYIKLGNRVGKLWPFWEKLYLVSVTCGPDAPDDFFAVLTKPSHPKHQTYADDLKNNYYFGNRTSTALVGQLVALKKTYYHCLAYQTHTGGHGDGNQDPHDYDRSAPLPTVLELIGQRLARIRQQRADIQDLTQEEYYYWTVDQEGGMFALIHNRAKQNPSMSRSSEFRDGRISPRISLSHPMYNDEESLKQETPPSSVSTSAPGSVLGLGLDPSRRGSRGGSQFGSRTGSHAGTPFTSLHGRNNTQSAGIDILRNAQQSQEKANAGLTDAAVGIASSTERIKNILELDHTTGLRAQASKAYERCCQIARNEVQTYYNARQDQIQLRLNWAEKMLALAGNSGKSREEADRFMSDYLSGALATYPPLAEFTKEVEKATQRHLKHEYAVVELSAQAASGVAAGSSSQPGVPPATGVLGPNLLTIEDD